MLFNSYIFMLVFLPLVVTGYFVLNHFKKEKLAKSFLVGMSLWFYGFFNYTYLLIIVSSILFNFNIGKILLKLEQSKKKKIIMIAGVLVNIFVLFYFKYFDFFIENINWLFKSEFTLLNIMLPLGISFFTFQQISYVVDSYKKDIPKYGLLDYSLFITFFPQLVAGPIVLHDEMIPQFENKENKKFNFGNFAKGMYALSLGLGKKVLLADTFAIFVSYGYSNIGALNSFDTIIVMLATTLQMYFDFSGYCDMATGIGYMFNVKLPMNFNSPYKATNIVDFWKRWHMTLTRFFTRYIYFPLGGNRKGEIRSYVNIFIVFFVSGFWHGADWVFVLWGVMHGTFNIFTRIFMKYFEKIPVAINWLITFTFVNFSRLLFRAQSLTEAKEIFARLFSFEFGSLNSELVGRITTTAEFKIINEITNWQRYDNIKYIMFALMFIIPLICVVKMRNTNEKLEDNILTNKKICVISFLIVYSIISFSGVSAFLYFDF